MAKEDKRLREINFNFKWSSRMSQKIILEYLNKHLIKTRVHHQKKYKFEAHVRDSRSASVRWRCLNLIYHSLFEIQPLSLAHSFAYLVYSKRLEDEEDEHDEMWTSLVHSNDYWSWSSGTLKLRNILLSSLRCRFLIHLFSVNGSKRAIANLICFLFVAFLLIALMRPSQIVIILVHFLNKGQLLLSFTLFLFLYKRTCNYITRYIV